MEELKLYLITDSDILKGRDFYHCIEEALKGGVTMLQLREKEADGKEFLEKAMNLRELTRKYDEFDTKVSYCIDNMESVSWDELQGEKGYLNSKGLQNKIVLRSWNEKEADMAYEYLRQILQSDDIPYPLHSVNKKDKLPSPFKSYDINYLVSHKGFAELFDPPVVAKKK